MDLTIHGDLTCSVGEKKKSRGRRKRVRKGGGTNGCNTSWFLILYSYVLILSNCFPVFFFCSIEINQIRSFLWHWGFFLLLTTPWLPYPWFLSKTYTCKSQTNRPRKQIQNSSKITSIQGFSTSWFDRSIPQIQRKRVKADTYQILFSFMAPGRGTALGLHLAS